MLGGAGDSPVTACLATLVEAFVGQGMSLGFFWNPNIIGSLCFGTDFPGTPIS